jgi:nickel-dependent lactate racemase
MGKRIRLVLSSFGAPYGTPRLREIARNKRRVLIVSEDVSRPTPVFEFIQVVLDELRAAGLEEKRRADIIITSHDPGVLTRFPEGRF